MGTTMLIYEHVNTIPTYINTKKGKNQQTEKQTRGRIRSLKKRNAYTRKKEPEKMSLERKEKVINKEGSTCGMQSSNRIDLHTSLDNPYCATIHMGGYLPNFNPLTPHTQI